MQIIVVPTSSYCFRYTRLCLLQTARADRYIRARWKRSRIRALQLPLVNTYEHMKYSGT